MTFSVKTYYAPGLDKVFGMFQLTHQTQQGGNRQQYETEGRWRSGRPHCWQI